jgi:hypothetical protein
VPQPIGHDDWDSARIEKHVLTLTERMADECETKNFLYVPSERVRFYKEPTKDWGDVPNRFGSTVFDVEESGKSFACERYTAAVFHVMRVLEAGLKALGSSLRDPMFLQSTNRSWDTILKKCWKELDPQNPSRAPTWQADPDFFNGVTGYLQNVKDAWRNPTMHVGQKYTEEETERIVVSARIFMAHLATKLHE